MTADVWTREEVLRRLAPESREFLLFLFKDLRDDLAKQAGYPDSDVIVRKRAVYDALLDGLASGEMSDEESVREYVTGLARATDEANQYEQVVLEHQAFAELVHALGGEQAEPPASGAVDWAGFLGRFLHQTQLQIIEAMFWINQPVSASQLIEVFEWDREELSGLAYHLRRLADLKIVRLSGIRRIRGAKERLYVLHRRAGK